VRIFFLFTALFLVGCSEAFMYKPGQCILNVNPDTSWHEQHAQVEGYGTVNEQRMVDGYVLRFISYESTDIVFQRDYVEKSTIPVSAYYCPEE